MSTGLAPVERLEGSPSSTPHVAHAATPVLFSPSPHAERRFWEFFTAHIRNPNTRLAYLTAARRFAAWCERLGLALDQVEPMVVAAYVEQLSGALSAPSVKQHLAALRMLFDWLVVGQVLPFNPAASVRGPKHFVKSGKTPALLNARRGITGAFVVEDSDAGNGEPARATGAEMSEDRKEAFELMLCAALADGLSVGVSPPAGLIDVALACGLTELRPHPMSTRVACEPGPRWGDCISPRTRA